MRDYDHHAKQKRDRIEINGAKGFLEAQGTNRDHRGAAEKGNPRAVEPQTGNAADGHANFCWFDVGEGRDEAQIVAGLAEQGVLVRSGTALGKEGALYTESGVMWQAIIHGLFIASAIGVAYVERLSQPVYAGKDH